MKGKVRVLFFVFVLVAMSACATPYGVETYGGGRYDVGSTIGTAAVGAGLGAAIGALTGGNVGRAAGLGAVAGAGADFIHQGMRNAPPPQPRVYYEPEPEPERVYIIPSPPPRRYHRHYRHYPGPGY